MCLVMLRKGGHINELSGLFLSFGLCHLSRILFDVALEPAELVGVIVRLAFSQELSVLVHDASDS